MEICYTYYQELFPSFLFPQFKSLADRVRAIREAKELTPQGLSDLRHGFNLASRRIWPCHTMQELLRSLPQEKLEAFMEKLLQEGSFAEFERSLSLFSEEELLKFSGFIDNSEAEKLFTAFGEVKLTALASGLEKERNALWKRFLIELKFFVYQLIELMIKITELDQLLNRSRVKQPPWINGSQLAWDRLMLYFKMVTFPLVLFGSIYAYTQKKLVALPLTAAAILTLLAIPIVYLRYLKPCPIDFPGLKNLSIELLRDPKAVFPRRDILQQIENAFKEKKGVILVGPPGVGKSWVIRSLVQEIAAKNICPFIRNSQLFSCNSASFADVNDRLSFSALEETFKGYEEQVIFFFDEFHSMFQDGGVFGRSRTELLKTFCEDFKYVIGATTIDEYAHVLEQQPAIVGRRFKVIQVDEMTDVQIKMALSFQLQHHHPTIDFDPAVLDHIIQKAHASNANSSVIDVANSILSSAIAKMTDTKPDALERRMLHLEEKEKFQEQSVINATSINRFNDLDELIRKLRNTRTKIGTVETQLKDEAKHTCRLERLEAYRLKLKRAAYSLSDTKQNPLHKRKWVELHARIHAATKVIEKERGLKKPYTRLNSALVDSLSL